MADALKAAGESLGQSISHLNEGENELVKQKLLQLEKRLEDQEKKADEREVVGKKRHEETSTALSLILSQLQGRPSNS